MIAWSVRAAVECPIVMHTFAISDGAGILKIAEQYGAQGILEPKRLGGDQVKNWQVMDYALRHIRSLGIEPDILVYLQTTSPQRTSNDIRRTLAHFDSPRIGGVISVSETDNKFLKSFLVRDGILELLSDAPWPTMLRSDLPRTYMINGAIMAVRARIYDRHHRLFVPRTASYVMPAERSIDIDYREQAVQAERQMRKDRRKISRP